MPRRAWIVHYGFFGVLEGKTQPCTEQLPLGFRDLSDATGANVGYSPPLLDDLLWGPQHTELHIQRLMRSTARPGQLNDDRAIELCLWLLERNEELVLWGDPQTSSCLSLLCALARFSERTNRFDQISLVVDARLPLQVDGNIETFLDLFNGRLPVRPFLAPLLAARRHFGSDSDPIEANVSELPSAVAEWVSLGNHLADLFPDERGLDRFDDRLLEHLTADWQRVSWPVAGAMLRLPTCLGLPGDVLWRRLLELSDHEELQSPLGNSNRGHELCWMKITDPGDLLNARVRITPFGAEVRSGQSDALTRRSIHRWIGGRLITRERLLRRSGSYRQQYYRHSIDPQSVPASADASEVMEQ